MSDKTNPVEELVGKSLTDYIEIVDNLDESSRKDFVEGVKLAANWKTTGQTDVVDRGTEAAELARLLTTLPPDIRKTSITAADIRDYENQIATERLLLENEVRGIVKKLKDNPSEWKISFKDKTYEIGLDDVNPIINDALEEAESDLRFFAASLEGKKPAAFLGHLKSERREKIGRHLVRTVYIDRVDVSHNLGKTFVAFNDRKSTIMVVKDHLRSVIKDRQKIPRYSTHYRKDVHERVYAEFFGEQGGLNEENLAVFVNLVLVHEKGHFKAQSEFGDECRLLLAKLMEADDPGLKNLDELYVDLSVVEHIVRMPENTREERRDKINAFRAWSVFRGKGTQFPFEECISNILLSAARVEGERVVVDWQVLRKNLFSLKAELRKIFDEINHHIRLNAVADVLQKEEHGDRDYVRQVYSNLKWRKIQEEKGKNPDLSEDKVTSAVTVLTVDNVVNRTDVLGRKILVSFQSDMIKYQRQIDDWMRRRLKLDDQTVPFKIPKVRVLTPDDVSPADLERLRNLHQKSP